MTTLAAAVAGCGVWSAFVIGLFGSAQALARHGWPLFGSALIPLAFAAFAAMFVYRHTARRRKTQALIGLLLTIFLAAAVYLVASQLFPVKLSMRLFRT